MSAFKKFLYQVYSLRWAFTRPVTVGVRVVLVKDNQVLLVKPSYQEGWYCVGGGVKRGETLEQTARREAREEVGAELGELEFIGLYSHFIENKSDHVAVFKCTDFTYTGKSDFEIERHDLFPLEALPIDLADSQEKIILKFLENQDGVMYRAW